MKRIQYACLNQTVHFKLKDDISHDMAVREAKTECECYKQKLEQGKNKYTIVDEQPQEDGSIIIKIKKQLNNYNIGNYLD